MTTYDQITAAPSGRLNPIAALARWIARRQQQRADRDAFRRLLSLDDHMLKDIGVTRGDVQWAANLPLECNAAKEVGRAARAGNY